MYYPLTPVFCKPKDEAEKKAWTLRFRQTFGITPMRFHQNEIRLEKRCKKYSVEYIAPELSDSVEAINERKVQLQRKCKAATDKIRRSRRSPSDREKERLREQSRNRKGNEPVNKNQSEIRTFRITGRGGIPSYSYLPVRLDSTKCVMNEEECESARNYLQQLRLGGQEQVKLNKPIPFYSHYKYVSTKMRNNVFMDGLQVEMCDTLKVLSAEIYINDNCTKRGSSVGFRPSAGFFRTVGDSTGVELGDLPKATIDTHCKCGIHTDAPWRLSYTNILKIYHFNFTGDSKHISVQVVAEIPNEKLHIIQTAKRIVDEKGKIWNRWNGGHLYDYLHEQGITQVRFGDVDFDVSHVRAGGNTHQIIEREILERDYMTGRIVEKPPAITRPPSKNSSEAKSNIYYPLTPIFCIPKDQTEKLEWKERFVQSFHVTPDRFRAEESKLIEKCKKNSVTYIAPQLEDSVDETLRRKYTLHAKIKASRQCKWRHEWRDQKGKKQRQNELELDRNRTLIYEYY